VFLLIFFFFWYIFIYFGGCFFFRLKYFLLWFSGWVLFVLFIGVAFLGYVLPWGQISFWGAAVITNFLSVVPYVGNNLVFWVWGDLIVSGFTLKFFYTAHFLLPLFCRVFILAHLILLHFFSSSGVLFSSNLSFKCSFFSKFLIKDFAAGVFLLLMMFFSLYIVLEEENFLLVDIVSSPLHIKPEWYFLCFYCVLRRVPSKIVGLVIIVLFICFICFVGGGLRNLKSSVLLSILPIFFLLFFVFLSVLGGQAITVLNTEFSQIVIILNFILFYFIFVV